MTNTNPLFDDGPGPGLDPVDGEFQPSFETDYPGGGAYLIFVLKRDVTKAGPEAGSHLLLDSLVRFSVNLPVVSICSRPPTPSPTAPIGYGLGGGHYPARSRKSGNHAARQLNALRFPDPGSTFRVES